MSEQALSIRAFWPGFKVCFTHISVKAVGEIKPTERSRAYLVEIKYRNTKDTRLKGTYLVPQIRILSPELETNFKNEKIPHIYPGKKLCLYRPKYDEFTSFDLLSQTIIPWVSLWLYHYEVWHLTGEWHGGGEHP